MKCNQNLRYNIMAILDALVVIPDIWRLRRHTFRPPCHHTQNQYRVVLQISGSQRQVHLKDIKIYIVI